MCEKSKCQHRAEGFCSCPPVKDRGENFLALLEHMAVNMTDIHWELDYADLNHPEKRRLCRVGACRICGGVLCHEMDASDALAGDDFLAAVYRHLYQVHNASGRLFMGSSEFREQFVQMFHEQDRPLIRQWLERPENQSVQAMYRRSSRSAYTIIHTCADADKGHFPPPAGEGTFSDIGVAREELERLVEEEKATMEIPFSEEEYREDCGDDFWEAYQDGYAAGWFTRYEIIESPLYLDVANEKEAEACPT